jgi:hypothetical protein
MAAAPGNFIDRAISFIAPVAGAKRMAARAALDSLKETTALYDGAARSFRTMGRRMPSTRAPTSRRCFRSAERLRDVSRDLRRNNALGRQRHPRDFNGHVVGAGIVPTIDRRQ